MSDVDNQEFAKRVQSACDNHPHAPVGRGLQAWIAQRAGVSPEAVRKWLTGNSRPRPAVMSRLAHALDVDEAWLALGVTPLRDHVAKKTFVRAANGAVHFVAGLLEMEGGKVAFPSEQDIDSPVDIHAIIDHRSLDIHVAVADRIGVARFRLTLPTNYDKVITIGVVPGRCLVPRLLLLPPDDVAEYGTSRGGYVELEVLADDGAFVTRNHEWSRITSFHNPLTAHHVATA